MAFAIPSLVASLAFLLLLQPLTARADLAPLISDLAPLISPLTKDICEDVQCGKGTCKSAEDMPFFECQCDPGWKQYNDGKYKYLPCIIPNCTLDRSCSQASAPAPEKARGPVSKLDVCHWVDCEGGSCNKITMFSYKCVCNSGYYNLLNVHFFPCYKECSVGLDCTELGISLKNGSTSSPPPKPKDDKKENEGLSASSTSRGSSLWLSILIMLMIKIHLQ